jgi:hypothetical protein
MVGEESFSLPTLKMLAIISNLGNHFLSCFLLLNKRKLQNCNLNHFITYKITFLETQFFLFTLWLKYFVER